MKLIIQLLIVALVINACVQGGRAALRNYELKDAVQQELRFGESETAPQLQARLVELAEGIGVTLDPSDVQVVKEGMQTSVSLSYVEDIQLIPRAYTHHQTFDVSMTERAMKLR